jgi:hypothetical protein
MPIHVGISFLGLKLKGVGKVKGKMKTLKRSKIWLQPSTSTRFKHEPINFQKTIILYGF